MESLTSDQIELVGQGLRFYRCELTNAGKKQQADEINNILDTLGIKR